MFKTRRSIPGSSPATLVPHLIDGVAVPPRITLIEFDKNQLEEREITDLADLDRALDHSKVTWINIDGLGDVEALKRLGQRFQLHPLTLEDVLTTGQRPKAEVFSDHLFFIVQMVYQDKRASIRGEQVSLFLGKGFLITIQEEADYDVFDPVRARLRSGHGQIRKSQADYLAYALLDSIIDH
ncbi:MAG: CorA family divalent cation transporter, partial [Akkermansiaceae bacterium]